MLNYTRLVWVPEDEPGIEDVRIAHDPRNVPDFSSTVIRLWEGQPLRVLYHLVCDAQWHARELAAASYSEVIGERTIRLYADGAGNWRDDKGQLLDALQGCIDVDIMVTPLTNTLPIRRLQLAPGESREIRVVYVAAPDLTIRPFQQRYTHLDDSQHYRYESLESGFTAELLVDDDGFIVDYPGIWRRVWPVS